MALDAGVEGIIVSNHGRHLQSLDIPTTTHTNPEGGRQVDGAIASLFALEQICMSPKIRAAQKSKKFTVLFDSGVRTGSDIMKALALGAQGILCA